MIGSGAVRRGWRRILGAAALAVTAAAVPYVAAPPATAESSCEAPERSIEAYRGFAVDGAIRTIDPWRGPSGWLARVTLDVLEPLTGGAPDELVFDLGSPACMSLDGERFKVGDRLILTAPAPPEDTGSAGTVRAFPGALAWRYEWGDRWSLHGLVGAGRSLARPIREASTRDAILELVAPSALPYAIDHQRWRVALGPIAGEGGLQDVVSWRDGFVALGSRTVGTGRAARTVPTIWTSADGRNWARIPATLPGAGPRGAVVERLVVFRDTLYALGRRSDLVVIWRSDDARRWERVVMEPWREQPPILDGRLVLTVGSVDAAATDARLIVHAHGSNSPADVHAIWTTDDGVAWSRAEATGLSFNAGRMISRGADLVIPDGQGSIRTSTDGIEWTRVGALPDGFVSLAWDATRSRFLAVTSTQVGMGDLVPGLVWSADGVDWLDLADPPAAVGDIALVEDAILLFGSRHRSHTSWMSADGGRTWSVSNLPGASPVGCVAGVAFGSAATVAVGGCRRPIAWVTER